VSVCAFDSPERAEFSSAGQSPPKRQCRVQSMKRWHSISRVRFTHSYTFRELKVVTQAQERCRASCNASASVPQQVDGVLHTTKTPSREASPEIPPANRTRSQSDQPDEPALGVLHGAIPESIPQGNPRATALASLFQHASALAASGDLIAARVVHEAIGKLLGAGEAVGAMGAAQGPSSVVDIAKARKARRAE